MRIIGRVYDWRLQERMGAVREQLIIEDDTDLVRRIGHIVRKSVRWMESMA